MTGWGFAILYNASKNELDRFLGRQYQTGRRQFTSYSFSTILAGCLIEIRRCLMINMIPGSVLPGLDQELQCRIWDRHRGDETLRGPVPGASLKS
jgi:hypothetical protein